MDNQIEYNLGDEVDYIIGLTSKRGILISIYNNNGKKTFTIAKEDEFLAHRGYTELDEISQEHIFNVYRDGSKIWTLGDSVYIGGYTTNIGAIKNVNTATEISYSKSNLAEIIKPFDNILTTSSDETYKVLGWNNLKNIYKTDKGTVNASEISAVYRDNILLWSNGYMILDTFGNLTITGATINNNKNNNNKNMEMINLLELAKQVNLKEPERTLRELGFTHEDGSLTEAGKSLFMNFLLTKYMEEFVKEVVTPIKEYKDKEEKKDK